MNITDINLGFLWIKNPNRILDAPDPFDEKWRDDYLKLYNFIEFEPLEKVIDLIILMYKDKYPKEVVYTSMSTMKTYKHIYKKEGYKITDGKHLVRNDIYKFKYKRKLDKDEFEYLVEMVLEFKDIISLAKIIEKRLKGKEYTKQENGDNIIYTINKSPLASVEITSKSFKMIINEDYYVFLGY